MIEPKPLSQRSSVEKFFSRLPGLIFVLIFAFFMFGGLVLPEVTAYAIIIMNVYFFYKSLLLAITFFISYQRIGFYESVNWLERLEHIKEPEVIIANLKEKQNLLAQASFQPYLQTGSTSLVRHFSAGLPYFFQKIVFAREKKKANDALLKQIKEIKETKILKNWHELQHIIIIPHVKEPEHILRETLDNISKQTFPNSQINVVLAAEGRDEEGYQLSLKLAEEYGKVFNHVWVSKHILTEDEVVGKSSNMKAGGAVAYEEVKKLGWDLKKILLTSCDADSKLPPLYLAYVTYKYVTTEHSEYKFYNAAMVFYNNIWRLPFYARVKNSMSSLFNTARLVRTDKLIPFSTYTTSFWVIKEINFWTPWVTPEDFHIFIKSQFKFGGVTSVIPIYLRINSDAAEGSGHKDTFKNNYKQERRWQWGISDDGWVLQNVFHGIGKYDFLTMYRAIHSVIDHILTPVMSIVILWGGNIPTLINPAFNSTVLGSQLPGVSSTIISVSFIFLLFIIIIDLFYRPPRDGKYGIGKVFLQLGEWIFFPISSFFLSVLPGVEANTRLLLGKNLEYYVTKKQ